MNTIRCVYWSLSLSLLFGLGVVKAQDSEIKVYTDIHVNSSSKAFNSRSTSLYSLWEQIDHRCGENVSRVILENYGNSLIKYSQSHFESLIRGNVRLACLSLSPIENQTLNPKFMEDQDKQTTISCLTGIVANQLFLRRSERDYFSNLMENIRFVKRFENEKYYINGFNYYYTILRDAEDMEEVINDPDRLGVVLTIEGGHALGHSIYIEEGITDLEEYETLVYENIKRLKGQTPMSDNTDEKLDVPILYMSLCKTYENGMGGQAQSLNKIQRYLFGNPTTVNDGVTQLGKNTVKRLLSREEGRRILIDVKHMSVAFRKWYYKYIDRLRILGDNVPVVASHCGISGLSWDDNFYKKRDDDNKNKNEYLNHWTQNLSEEDINFIYDSDGLIGLALDKTILCGAEALEEINNTIPGTKQKREAIVKAIAANILTIVETINKKDAWSIISIGSDYDAMLEPMETYKSAEQMPDLARDLQRFFENPKKIGNLFSPRKIKTLMFGYKPSEITDMIMSRNAQEFIKRNIKG